MASVRQIAKRVGVSVATVSRALNNDPGVNAATRDRVLAVANRAGYAPTMGKRLTTVVALAYPREPVRADYGAFDNALLTGILRGVAEQRFDVQLVSIQRDKRADEAYTQFFHRKGVRGVILRSFQADRTLVRDVAAEGFPAVVVADRFPDDPGVNFIACDSRDDSRRAVAHLIHLGHRRIALAVHNVPDTDHLDRRAGYLEAHDDAGLRADPEMLIEIVASMDGGGAAIGRLLNLPDPPTAVFFTDPLATLGALRRCQELGVAVPQELSVVGFDDSDTRRHTWPPYTAVCQDAEMLGHEASLWLTRTLSGHASAPLRLVRPTFLEINRSTAPPPRHPPRIAPAGGRLPVSGDD